jgi:hypothetical protein
MPDVELNKANEAHSRTDIHAENFGFNHDFVFSADASTNTSGPLPNIDGLRGRGRGLRFGVIGWTETAKANPPAGGLAGVVGTGFDDNPDPSKNRDAAGVIGFSNSHEGVFGLSSEGRGVSGLSADPTGTGAGVHGAAQGSGPGVEGHANQTGDGVVGFSPQGHGVSGTSHENHAVFGDNLKNKPQGFVLLDATTGCYGVTMQNRGVAGVIGREGIGVNKTNEVGQFAAGVYGSSEHHVERNQDRQPVVVDKGFAGLFWGPVVVLGPLIQAGPGKSGAVPHKDGSHRLVYSMESPETWFEDFGEAKLVRGKARVKIIPDFAAIVDTKAYYVFLTPHGDSAGLFVAARSSGDFEVREHGGGKSSLSFAYRIVAHPRQSDAKRLAKIKLPPLPQARG